MSWARLCLTISLSDDHDHGPAAIDNDIQRTHVQPMGCEEICRYIVELLRAAYHTSGFWKIRRFGILSREHMESARFLCTHRLVLILGLKH